MIIYKEVEENKQIEEQRSKKIEEELKMQIEKQNQRTSLLEKYNLTLEQNLTKVKYVLDFRCNMNQIVFMKRKQKNKGKVQ